MNEMIQSNARNVGYGRSMKGQRASRVPLHLRFLTRPPHFHFLGNHLRFFKDFFFELLPFGFSRIQQIYRRSKKIYAQAQLIYGQCP